jgi:hypothetical protein
MMRANDASTALLLKKLRSELFGKQQFARSSPSVGGGQVNDENGHYFDMKKLLHFKQKLLHVLIFVGIFMSGMSHAAPSSTWSRPPTWASEDSPAPTASHRAVKNREMVSNDLSPFSPGSNNLAVDLGQVFLMGDLNSKYNDSIGTQLHYTYGVSDLFGFDSSLGYSEHSDGGFSMTTLLTGLRMNLSWYDKVVPYAVFGLGFYRPYYKDTNPQSINPSGVISDSSPMSAVLFGVHLGPGIDLQLNRNLFFGAAVTFHNMFGTTKNLANGTPLYLGGAFTSFFLHIGATF